MPDDIVIIEKICEKLEKIKLYPKKANKQTINLTSNSLTLIKVFKTTKKNNIVNKLISSTSYFKIDADGKRKKRAGIHTCILQKRKTLKNIGANNRKNKLLNARPIINNANKQQTQINVFSLLINNLLLLFCIFKLNTAFSIKDAPYTNR